MSAQFFTLWMGSIYNIPNYAAVGGFISFRFIAAASYVGSCVKLISVANFHEFEWRGWLLKYGIPLYALTVYRWQSRGKTARVLKRRCVAAIAWFGLAKHLQGDPFALLIILGKFWPKLF